jgi:hypothetical protein
MSLPDAKLSRLTMRIDVPLSDDERRRLAQALGTQRDVDRVAAMVAKAGARELLAQATGAAVFSSITDLKHYRIYMLLHQGLTLDEAERVVAALFKVTGTAARRLVGNAIARYSVELRDALERALVELLEAATWNPEVDRWEVRIPSAFVRERVRDVLSQLPLPDPVPAQRGPLWRYADETYQALRMHFGLAARPPS